MKKIQILIFVKISEKFFIPPCKFPEKVLYYKLTAFDAVNFGQRKKCFLS